MAISTTTIVPPVATPVRLKRIHRMRGTRLAKSLARRVIDGCVEGYLRIDCTSPGPVWEKGHFDDSTYYGACDYPFLV